MFKSKKSISILFYCVRYSIARNISVELYTYTFKSLEFNFEHFAFITYVKCKKQTLNIIWR